MASDKERMLANANSYASVVAAAKRECKDAKSELDAAIRLIEENWKGKSGAAMEYELTVLRNEVSAIRTDLVNLEKNMRSHATNIYNNWPEESGVEE